MGSEKRRAGLLADAEAIDHCPIALELVPLEIVQQPPPLPNQLEQAASRMMILRVGLEVLSEIPDAVTEQRDLNLG
jgi:hypothetical protein